MVVTETRIEVNEDIGKVLVPMRRSGDLTEELLVVCSTLEGMSRSRFTDPQKPFKNPEF